MNKSDEINEFIKEDDIYNICRIDYMPTSNWVMGNDRFIYSLTIDEENLKYYVYVGDPLVPEYGTRESNTIFYKDQKEKLLSNKLYAANHLDVYDIYALINKLEPWKWQRDEHGQSSNLPEGVTCIDGEITDLAFYVKNEDGEVKICHYQFVEDGIGEDNLQILDMIFRVTGEVLAQLVEPDTERMKASKRLLPGFVEQELNRHKE